jgi:hypothetical protein
MLRDTITSLAVAAGPLLLAWIGAMVRRLLAQRLYVAQTRVLERRARAVVAETQGSVDALKNPARPGVWSPAMAASVRAEAIRRVRALEPLACQTVLEALDGDDAKLSALIGTYVEESVRTMRQWEETQPAVTALANERALPRPEAPAPIAPANPQAGHIRAAALGVLLLISAGLLTTRCRPATDAGYALAGLPPATQCNAREYRCNAGIPEVCERGNTTTGALRWWPTVPPGPDGRRVPCARCVVDVDGGRAHCGAVDAVLATDGGAP